MLTLQLKRTERSINDNEIKLVVLAKGEPFILIESSRKLLFIGDGESTLSQLYNNGFYVIISKYIASEQIISISADKLPDGIATVNQLQALQDEFDGLSLSMSEGFEELDSKIDLNKLYYANCYTSGSDSNKIVNIDIPLSNLTDYQGLTIVVNFQYGNTSSEPVLNVQTLDGTAVVNGKMYVGNSTISGAFNWKDNDTLIFTYTKINASLFIFSMAGTSAQRVLASWCSSNDVTLINGGMIATGSVTADKIAAGSITADQIATGSLSADVLSSQFSSALNNLNFIEQQAASSKQVICTCETEANEIIKEVYLNGDAALSVSIVNEAPLYGTVLVVKFTNENTSNDGCSLRLILDGIPFPRSINNVPPIGYYDNDNIFHGLTLGSELNWSAGETRVLIFDGSHWLIQPPSGYLKRAAEWCLSNNQTFIQGGSIIAGRISCAQLDAGTIDTSKISLSYYSTDSDGNILNYGGFDHFDGSTDIETTKGVIMYGSDPDKYSIKITNKGIVASIEGGAIQGWDREFNLDADSIKFGQYSSQYGDANDKLNLFLYNLPTSDPHTVGRIYNDNNILKISTG